VQGDSQFNEGFATAVEEAGVQRWMELYGNDAMRANYVRYNARRQDFLDLLVRHRKMLADNYAGKTSVKHKRAEKARIFASLKSDYLKLKESWGGYAGYDRWFAEPLTNAHLSAVGTYHDYLPAFRTLLKQERTFVRFYVAVQKLAALDSTQRQAQLRQLDTPALLNADAVQQHTAPAQSP
jgi:predicted aminopeptidase